MLSLCRCMTQADVCNEAPRSRRPVIMTARRRRRVCFIFAPSQPWASLSPRSLLRPNDRSSVHPTLSLSLAAKSVSVSTAGSYFRAANFRTGQGREARSKRMNISPTATHHRHPEVKELVRTDTRPPPLSLSISLFAPNTLARLSPPAPTVFSRL